MISIFMMIPNRMITPQSAMAIARLMSMIFVISSASVTRLAGRN